MTFLTAGHESMLMTTITISSSTTTSTVPIYYYLNGSSAGVTWDPADEFWYPANLGVTWDILRNSAKLDYSASSLGQLAFVAGTIYFENSATGAVTWDTLPNSATSTSRVTRDGRTITVH